MYAFGRDFTAAADGSDIRFGDDLKLTGGYPGYRLTGLLGGVAVELDLRCHDTVSWFFRSPVYKHLSLLTDYRGTLTTDDETVEVSGLCSFEYGACPSPYLAAAKPLPDLETTMDTPFTYGLGSGFVGGFAHESQWRRERVSGRGYVEYIDRRAG